MKPMEIGDVCYTYEGVECKLVAKLGDGGAVVVERFHNDPETGETVMGDPEVLSRVFGLPPIERKHKRLTDLEAAIRDAEAKVTAKQKELRDVSSRHQEMMKRLTSYKALERVDDLLAGRMTHFVEWSCGIVKIKTKDEMLEVGKGDRYGNFGQLRLLTLFGELNGGLQWKINRYSDGSGDDTDVYPCFSLDEAHEIAKGVIAAELARPTDGFLKNAVAMAKLHGVAVPPEKLMRSVTIDREYLQNSRDEARKRLAECEVKLDEQDRALAELEVSNEA